MSVLGCNRRDCENIFCERYSKTHGYICNDCFDELVNSGATTNITTFMNTSKEDSVEKEGYEPFYGGFLVESNAIFLIFLRKTSIDDKGDTVTKGISKSKSISKLLDNILENFPMLIKLIPALNINYLEGR